MRSGKLLAEDSPSNLLKIHQCITLEDVFLKLCMKDKSTNNASNVLEILPNNVAATDATLNMVSVYNERNKHHSEGVVQGEDNGIVGLTFHQSKDNLVNPEDRNMINKEIELKPDPMYNRVNQVAEDCADCCRKPCCSYDVKDSLNRLRALIIKNFICMWRNIGYENAFPTSTPVTFTLPLTKSLISHTNRFMLFIFVLPAIQVILFCLAVGREPLDMKFGVINHEVPEFGICHGPEGCTTMNLSCRYLDTLPPASVRLVSDSN